VAFVRVGIVHGANVKSHVRQPEQGRNILGDLILEICHNL
jgi:hypothetical protein